MPDELSETESKELTLKFARHLVNKYGVAADVTIHVPHVKGASRNRHAHILTTTRKINPDGSLSEKTRILDDKKTKEVERIRETWAYLANEALARADKSERISHKSLEAQGVERMPTIHLGPAATAMERRGIKTERGEYNREVLELGRELKHQ